MAGGRTITVNSFPSRGTSPAASRLAYGAGKLIAPLTTRTTSLRLLADAAATGASPGSESDHNYTSSREIPLKGGVGEALEHVDFRIMTRGRLLPVGAYSDGYTTRCNATRGD